MANYSASRLGRARIRSQSDWGFSNAVASGTFAAGDTLSTEVFLPPLVEEPLVSMQLKGAWHSDRVIPGRRSGVEITINKPLEGLSASAPTAEPTITPDMRILASCLGYGGATTAGFDAVNLAGGTTTAVDWTDASGLASGQALLIPIASGHSIGWIQGITEDTQDTLDLISPLSAAPAASGQVYGSYIVGEGVSSTGTSTPFTLQWYGQRGEQVRLYDGVCTQATISRQGNGQVMLSATLRFGGWIVDAGSGTALARYPHPYPQLAAALGCNGARVVIDGTPSTTIGSFELSLTHEVMEALSMSGYEGLGAYATVSRSASLSMTNVSPNLADLARPGDSLGTVQIDLGISPGRAFSILVPAAQVEAMEAISDSEGVIGTSLALSNGYYADDSGATAPANSSVRLAWM